MANLDQSAPSVRARRFGCLGPDTSIALQSSEGTATVALVSAFDSREPRLPMITPLIDPSATEALSTRALP